MKKALLLAFIIPLIGFSQTTRVSTMDGDFLNPLAWSPIGFPQSGDSVVIDHIMTLTTNIYYTAGTIYIRSTGQMVEDATERVFWSDGGNMINEGTIDIHLLGHSLGGYFENYGMMVGIDSIWNQGDFYNDGTMDIYDILNDETSDFDNEGSIDITNNFVNQGEFYNAAQGEVQVNNDFANCNTQTLTAYFENDGIFCIGNNFSNCGGDEMDGTGNYFVGGTAANLGDFVGTFIFHTASGTVVNTGSIDPGVTIIMGSCNLAVGGMQLTETALYPNPTEGIVTGGENGATYVVLDVSGRLMLTGTVENNTIDFSSLDEGIYTIQIGNARAQRIIKL